MYYIATFYSHFGAIRFKKEASDGIMAPCLMPVPRRLSSSCGTCVRFEGPADFTFTQDDSGEVEQIVRETDTGYMCIYTTQE
ncbi:hypothetical protein AB840_07240 [Megasphaera cerevisiae DSM 20462]|jgi:hypothetical protein|uniref:Putative Se/S carrier protein-like domain-containing protein n=1 Tax=Megasphaera cerevisiae DSM 20462 TaxID=1122219 RepID=A0A0J6WSW1_9FIRM|nr:DUF3343 domain-containing protein [Megasphaera cerevisiae]KMO86595.1 hypothetical protein AB840_07240 [Megasphaera cerevisiae DSM 20462]OKY53269.1 hypothetical protein BSR42_08480 [Megasphaera cerevisiae]SJZ69621.1 Protein of unknown function [Megasphaera cerevisiae DSM 20462]